MAAPLVPPTARGPELERLGHDVRLDGVAFWRIRAPASFRRQLAPGGVVYFLAVVRGRSPEAGPRRGHTGQDRRRGPCVGGVHATTA